MGVSESPRPDIRRALVRAANEGRHRPRWRRLVRIVILGRRFATDPALRQPT